MSERYCGFILIMPGKNRMSIAQQDRMSIAWQTRISIARRCLPKAGTSASWSMVAWCTVRTLSPLLLCVRQFEGNPNPNVGRRLPAMTTMNMYYNAAKYFEFSGKTGEASNEQFCGPSAL